MIQFTEYRPGNIALHKSGHRILPVPLQLSHFSLMEKEGASQFFPVALKPEWLTRSGFSENKDYALLPSAREFVLLLALPGQVKQEIRAYEKNNKECFGRFMVDGQAASQNFHFLHQLQNIFYALTGLELTVSLK
jgi:hypothetical protein